jgi:hypothetical protein
MPLGLAYDDQFGLLYYGPAGLFSVRDDGTVEDLTPLLPHGSELRRATITDLAVFSPGVWYALDAEEIVLRHTLDGWEYLAGEHDYLLLRRILPGGHNLDLIALSPSEVLVAGPNRLALYRDDLGGGN